MRDAGHFGRSRGKATISEPSPEVPATVMTGEGQTAGSATFRPLAHPALAAEIE